MNDPFLVASEISELAAHEIFTAWDSLPEQVRDALAAVDYGIVIGRRLVDAYPKMADEHPRGYPEGATFRNVDGYWFGARRQIAVFQQREVGGRYVDSTRLAGVLRHEVGHAYDACIGASASGVFRECYIEDTCGGESPRYFLQHDAAGYEECFAEIFAQRLGGGSGENIQVAFEECDKLVARILIEGPAFLAWGRK